MRHPVSELTEDAVNLQESSSTPGTPTILANEAERILDQCASPALKTTLGDAWNHYDGCRNIEATLYDSCRPCWTLRTAHLAFLPRSDTEPRANRTSSPTRLRIFIDQVTRRRMSFPIYSSIICRHSMGLL